MRSPEEMAFKVARARRLRRGWSSTDQSHACVSSMYLTRCCRTMRRDAQLGSRCFCVPLQFPPNCRPGVPRVRAAYGRNYERLAAIKRRYDPDNLFKVNHNILPLP